MITTFCPAYPASFSAAAAALGSAFMQVPWSGVSYGVPQGNWLAQMRHSDWSSPNVARM